MQRKVARISFRLPKELRKSLEQAAKRTESSMSEVVVTILKNCFPLERKKTVEEIFQELDEIVAEFELEQSRGEKQSCQTKSEGTHKE